MVVTPRIAINLTVEEQDNLKKLIDRLDMRSSALAFALLT